MRNTMVGDRKDSRIAEYRFTGAFGSGVPIIGSLNVFSQKQHDIRDSFHESVDDSLCANFTLLEIPCAAAAKTESAPDLLLKRNGDAVQNRSDMKSHAFFTEFSELEISGKKDGSDLLHYIQAAFS
jgi:hypothetical protein